MTVQRGREFENSSREQQPEEILLNKDGGSQTLVHQNHLEVLLNRLPGLHPGISEWKVGGGTQSCTFLGSFLKTLMLLIWRPHLKNCCLKHGIFACEKDRGKWVNVELKDHRVIWIGDLSERTEAAGEARRTSVDEVSLARRNKTCSSKKGVNGEDERQARERVGVERKCGSSPTLSYFGLVGCFYLLILGKVKLFPKLGRTPAESGEGSEITQWMCAGNAQWYLNDHRTSVKGWLKLKESSYVPAFLCRPSS